MFTKHLYLHCPINTTRIVDFQPVITNLEDGKKFVFPLNICDDSPGLSNKCKNCVSTITSYVFHNPDFHFQEPIYLSDIQEDI